MAALTATIVFPVAACLYVGGHEASVTESGTKDVAGKPMAQCAWAPDSHHRSFDVK
jgi:hypothetical protein